MTPYYQDSAVTIYHGDCAALVPSLGRFDLLLTDPPYGIGADKHQGKRENGWKQYGGEWDNARPSRWVVESAIARCDGHIIWGGNYFADWLPAKMGWLVWNKMQRNFSLADGELAWTSYEKALRIADISRGEAIQDGKEHPTQKSVELFRWCIQYADRARGADAANILDPFMGSGTTLRAAKDLGRKAIGIEIEERYCEIAARRMSQEVLAL